MQANATVQQQQQYKQKLLQQQQQQMAQFQSPGPAVSMVDPGSMMVQSPIQMTGPMVPPPLQMTPRQQSLLPSSTSTTTSRMGPPATITGQGMAAAAAAASVGGGVGGPGGSLSMQQQQQQQISPLPASESATYFGPGAGLARLHQYAEALKEGPDRQTSEYWKAFVDEFYLPTSTMHLVLWNPSTREHKGFEVPAAVVSRWMQTNYISGVTSTNISMENPREYLSGQPFPPPPRTIRADFHLPSGSVTHFVESKRALFISNFDNGWQVQMTGLIRASFVPHTKLRSSPDSPESSTVQTHLRLECLEVLIVNHRSYVPSGANMMQTREEQIPQRIVRSILAANGHDDTSAESKKGINNSTDDFASLEEEEEKSDFCIPVNQVCLPESPVNEYGITLRAMRCLEITESVCQLRDLMDFSMRDKDKHAGPIEGLRRLTAQYRAGVGPNNALQFDFNTSPGSREDPNKMMKKRSQQSDSAAGGGGANESDAAAGNTNGSNARQGPGPSPKLSSSKRQRG